jgi:TetR/AcrR family tetracycline transcriptional repressor
VARPKVPLISRREVVRTALAILDAEGMHALSIRRLGAELRVNGASLYHHFANKDEILVAVGRAVLAEIDVPPVTGDGVDWIVHMALQQRRVLLRHPEVIPLLSRGYLRVAQLPAYEQARSILAGAGVPAGSQAAALDIVQSLIVGSVVVLLMPPEAEAAPTAARIMPLHSRHNGATAARQAEEAFELSLRCLLECLPDRFPHD